MTRARPRPACLFPALLHLNGNKEHTACLSQNSNADRISPKCPLASPYTFCTASYDGTEKTATFIALGRRGQRIEMAVIMPMVPSDPMNSCFRSKPGS